MFKRNGQNYDSTEPGRCRVKVEYEFDSRFLEEASELVINLIQRAQNTVNPHDWQTRAPGERKVA